ncbi:dihydroorotate dehydrogenase-like protein [Tannerella forsythia]|uniref:dihydroorotate dehydrogenase-like protein n=1 Tax=Tannerella forsythia TaxID=28112 RepID=UPI0028DBC62F|nr:dihydroorotate dehydrogenase-like protein [Tannerella forsythia]
MIRTETKYAGLTLRNPLIIGSSGLTSKVERNKSFEEAGAGAIVLKSMFEEQIEAQSDVLMQEAADYPEAVDYVRHYVKANQSEEYLTLIRETKAQCTIPIIASVNCYKADTWVDFARQIEAAGADALELNVFYLCTDLYATGQEVVNVYTSILKKVKEQISIPVIMKIGKGFSNIPAVVNLLKGHGADGVVLFNRYYQPDIDIHSCRITSGQVFSSHSDLSDTLRWTALVSGIFPDVSLAASTGVHEWKDVIKCILAGASAVQLCTTVYKNGMEIVTQMLTCLEEWMAQQKYQSIDEFKGRLSFSKAPNASMYERTQFMKYFGSV